MAAEGDEVHPIYRNNPLELKALLNCRLRVTSVEGTGHEGWVAAVDPVSESVILVDDPASDCPSVEVLFGYNIANKLVLSQDCDEKTRLAIQYAFTGPSDEVDCSAEAIVRRRAAAVNWLRRQRLPVEESGDRLLVAGVATLTPPYTSPHCACANELVLQRICQILDSMPPDTLQT